MRTEAMKPEGSRKDLELLLLDETMNLAWIVTGVEKPSETLAFSVRIAILMISLMALSLFGLDLVLRTGQSICGVQYRSSSQLAHVSLYPQRFRISELFPNPQLAWPLLQCSEKYLVDGS
jgi:hypothetical protein